MRIIRLKDGMEGRDLVVFFEKWIPEVLGMQVEWVNHLTSPRFWWQKGFLESVYVFIHPAMINPNGTTSTLSIQR